LSADPVQLPVPQEQQEGSQDQPDSSVGTEGPSHAEPISSDETIARPETPSTSETIDSTTPTTPASAQQPAAGETTPVAPKPHKSTIPAIPVIPALPKAVAREAPKPTFEKASEESQVEGAVSAMEQTESTTDTAIEAPVEEAKVASPPQNAWAQKKAWSAAFNPATASAATNGGSASNSTSKKPSAESFAEALRSFDAVSNNSKVAFLEPRGLVNTGNMCYMNSVS